MALNRLICALEQRREFVRRQMLDALSSLRYRQLIGAIEIALKLDAPADAEGTAIDEWAALAIPKAYKRFHRKAKKVEASGPAEALHSLRKRAKRLRYTVEFVHELYGKAGKQLLNTLEALQDLLGEHQDCVASIPRLQDLALDESAGLTREAVLLTGRLIAEKDHRMEELRSQLAGTLSRVEKDWKPLHGRR